MQEFIRILNLGWVGTIVGVVGVTVGLLSYWRTRIPGIIAFQSHDVSMIGGDNAVFPSEVEVRYRKTPVPRVTSSTIWMWNAGKKTMEGEDIIEHDPLRLRFSGEVLNVRIIKVTREVLQIKADKAKDASEEGRRTVYCSFGFLDPGDGGVLEVLHTGSAEAPKCIGTIKKLPKGIQELRFAAPYVRSATPYKPARGISWFIAIVMSILGLIILKGVFTGSHDPPIHSVVYWISALFGLYLLLEAVVAILRLRRQVPASLRLRGYAGAARNGRKG